MPAPSPHRRPRTVAAVVAALTVASLATACSSPTPPGTDLDSISVGVPAILGGFDPAADSIILYSADSWAVYEALVVWNQDDSTFEPWLAEKIDIADDGSSITLTLRDDVVFTDGVKLDAPGVEKVYDALIASDAYTYAAALRAAEVEFTAVDDRTLEVTSARPLGFHELHAIALTPIPSPATIDDPSLLADGPVGTGPYLITDRVADVEVSVERNPDYWNPDAYPFDEITFTVYADTVAALNALKTGQIDVASLSIPLAAEAEADGFAIHTGSGNFRTLLIKDHQGEVLAPLGDVRVRQAISYAFDRETIAETMDLGYGNPSSQPFPVGAPGYVEGADDRYAFDPDRARELLAEAGYPDGFDLTIPTFGAITAEMEPIVQQTLSEIGIDVTYDVRSPDDFFAGVTDPAYPVLMFTGIYINVLFIGPGSLLGPFATEESSRLVAAFENAGLGSDHDATALELGEFLIEEAWYVPFSQPENVYASIPEIDIRPGTQLGGMLELRSITRAADAE